jgi:predicted RNA-binding Zn ribbon-like protein
LTNFLFVADQRALDFVNTQFVVAGEPVDRLQRPSDLREWLIEAGLISRREGEAFAPVEAKQGEVLMSDAGRLRGALRSMAEAMARRRPIPPSALKTINEFLGRLREGYQLDGSHGQYRIIVTSDAFEPLHGLARVAKSAADLIANGKANAVRKCGNPSCVLYFYDTTKNRTRQWCSMATCGNRMKVAAYHHRHPRRR